METEKTNLTLWLFAYGLMSTALNIYLIFQLLFKNENDEQQ